MISPAVRGTLFRPHGKDDATPFYGKHQTRRAAFKMMSLLGDCVLPLSLDISNLLDFADSNCQIRDAFVFHASALFPF